MKIPSEEKSYSCDLWQFKDQFAIFKPNLFGLFCHLFIYCTLLHVNILYLYEGSSSYLQMLYTR